MKGLNPNTEDLTEHVRYLEDRVRALRLSRRILMNIIYAQVADRQSSLARLRTENHRLQKANCRYARLIMEGNTRIQELEVENRRLRYQSLETASPFSLAGHSSSS